MPHASKEKEFQFDCKKLRLIVMDVDGVLTNGKLHYSNNNHGSREFDVKDGMGVKLLQSVGLEIAWMSGGHGGFTEQRAVDLDVRHVFTKIKDKSTVLSSLQNQLDIDVSQTAYLGDDVNDLIVMPFVNLFFAPADAHPACLQQAHWVGSHDGGDGFVREIADHIISNFGVNPCQPFDSLN